MNSKLCKKLRKAAKLMELSPKGYEHSMSATINTKETERGAYRHLKRNVREITS